MRMSDGAERLSMAMSLKDKWAEGSNSEAEGAVNSADLRNPKKPDNRLLSTWLSPGWLWSPKP